MFGTCLGLPLTNDRLRVYKQVDKHGPVADSLIRPSSYGTMNRKDAGVVSTPLLVVRTI